MRQALQAAMAAAGIWATCDTARAELMGLRVFREGLYGLAEPVDGPHWIYRVYAEFDDPTDVVVRWGVGGSLGTGQIRNITLDGSLGSGFNNVPDNGSGNLAPDHPLTPRDWDTYMTLGVIYGNIGPSGVDGTNLFGTTPTFIPDGSPVWTAVSGFVYLDPPYTQGRSDFFVFENDTNTRVLLMQLVVNPGEHVDGTIGLQWRSQGVGHTTTALAFSSIPAPSSLAAFLLLVTLGNRRKRIIDCS